MGAVELDLWLKHVCVCFDRRWWEFSWWSACWLPASCRGWLHIAHLHAGSSAMEGTITHIIKLYIIHIIYCALYTHMCLLFLPVCSGSNTRQKESCVHWLGSRCPNRPGETGGSGGRVWWCRELSQQSSLCTLCNRFTQSPVLSVLNFWT